MVDCFETRGEVSGDFSLALQVEACGKWECGEVQSQVCSAVFSQVEGIDYDETFAPLAQYTSIRALISIAAEMGWKIHQMDVKTAFLNG